MIINKLFPLLLQTNIEKPNKISFSDTLMHEDLEKINNLFRNSNYDRDLTDFNPNCQDIVKIKATG